MIHFDNIKKVHRIFIGIVVVYLIAQFSLMRPSAFRSQAWSRRYALRFHTQLGRGNRLYASSRMDYRGASNALGSDDRDILLSAMSGGEQDISVKVVSCHNAVNKAFQHRPAPSITAQRAVGEIMACTLLLGSGMKDNETLQVTIQGNGGLRRVVACTDHLLNVRASVSDASYELKDIATDTPMSTMALFGEGQISVLRNHPSYKQPMNGIVAIRNADIALNMALYISESEQRRCAVLLQTAFKGFKCVDAVGIYVEAFPYAMDSNVELAIRNLEAVNKAGLLNAYKSFSVPEDTFETFPEQTEMQTVRKDCPNAHRLIDAVLTDGLSNSMRWKRDVDYKCTCSMDNVWRAIAALPKAQLKDIINEFPTSVKTTCDFCGCVFNVPSVEIQQRVIDGTI